MVGYSEKKKKKKKKKKKSVFLLSLNTSSSSPSFEAPPIHNNLEAGSEGAPLNKEFFVQMAGTSGWGAMSVLEQDVFHEINVARTQPGLYAEIIAAEQANIGADGHLSRKGQAPLRLNEGSAAYLEAAAALLAQPVLQALSSSPIGMVAAARSHATDLAPGRSGHTGSDGSTAGSRLNKNGRWDGTCLECITYGSEAARHIVVSLLVDDGVPSRGHRNNLLHNGVTACGVAVGRHTVHKVCCVITLAGSYVDRPGAVTEVDAGGVNVRPFADASSPLGAAIERQQTAPDRTAESSAIERYLEEERRALAQRKASKLAPTTATPTLPITSPTGAGPAPAPAPRTAEVVVHSVPPPPMGTRLLQPDPPGGGRYGVSPAISRSGGYHTAHITTGGLQGAPTAPTPNEVSTRVDEILNAARECPQWAHVAQNRIKQAALPQESPMVYALEKGARVRTVGLTKNPQFNDKIGSIVEMEHEMGAFRVLLDAEYEARLMLPQNLTVMPKDTPLFLDQFAQQQQQQQQQQQHPPPANIASPTHEALASVHQPSRPADLDSIGSAQDVIGARVAQILEGARKRRGGAPPEEAAYHPQTYPRASMHAPPRSGSPVRSVPLSPSRGSSPLVSNALPSVLAAPPVQVHHAVPSPSAAELQLVRAELSDAKVRERALVEELERLRAAGAGRARGVSAAPHTPMATSPIKVLSDVHPTSSVMGTPAPHSPVRVESYVPQIREKAPSEPTLSAMLGPENHIVPVNECVEMVIPTAPPGLMVHVGAGRGVLYEELGGRYTMQGEALHGRPLYRQDRGEGWLYCSRVGLWTLCDDRGHFGNGSGFAATQKEAPRGKAASAFRRGDWCVLGADEAWGTDDMFHVTAHPAAFLRCTPSGTSARVVITLRDDRPLSPALPTVAVETVLHPDQRPTRKTITTTIHSGQTIPLVNGHVRYT